MKNLAQIRAGNALKAAENRYEGVNDGEVVKKIPALIRQNGVIAALAFAVEKNDKGRVKNEGHYGVWRAIIEHLAHKEIHRLARVCTPEDFIKVITQDEGVSAAKLRDITEEILAYLNYLRRFA